MSELEPRHGLSANKDLSVWFSVCVYVRMIQNYTNTATSSSNANNESKGGLGCACKREATPIKRKLLVPIAAGMLTH